MQCVLVLLLHRQEAVHGLVEPRTFAQQRLRAFLIIPQGRIFDQVIELLQTLDRNVEVKDASSGGQEPG